jgi:uncharacterized iron-regulated membrane protein
MRKLLFQIHLWTGLILFLPLVALGLSGSALIAFEAIEGAKGPAQVQAEQAPHSYDEIAAAALAAAPKGARVSAFTAPARPTDAAQVRVGRGPRGGTLIDVDPYTLKILHVDKGGGRNTLFRFAHDLHGRLLINGPLGRPIVGWLGVAMCALGLSGIVIWWPRRGQWRRAFTISLGKNAYRVNRDLHGATGIWILAVFMIVSVTGVAISFPAQTTSAITALAPGRDLRASQNAIEAAPGEGRKPIGLDEAAALARAAAPDARLISLAPALRPGQPVRVMMAHPGYRDRTPALNVLIDPYRARVIEVRDPRAYTLGENLQAWQRALHEGSGFGPIWKVLVFISGLVPLLFAVTGVSMWLLKRKARAAMLTPGVELVD